MPKEPKLCPLKDPVGTMKTRWCDEKDCAWWLVYEGEGGCAVFWIPRVVCWIPPIIEQVAKTLESRLGRPK
jgi:hypothetical protein